MEKNHYSYYINCKFSLDSLKLEQSPMLSSSLMVKSCRLSSASLCCFKTPVDFGGGIRTVLVVESLLARWFRGDDECWTTLVLLLGRWKGDSIMLVVSFARWWFRPLVSFIDRKPTSFSSLLYNRIKSDNLQFYYQIFLL